MADPLLIAKNAGDLVLLPQMANRHGLVCGATGTGKTVTIQSLAERFSDIGVPVFVADVKGDMAGLSQPRTGMNEKIEARLTEMAIPDYTPLGYPVVFWDILGAQGHPVRTTVSDMGPLLLARLMRLNDTQAGVLQIAFAYADAEGLLLLDLKDLRALLNEVNDKRKVISAEYGQVSPQSIGAIQRAVLTLEQGGASQYFGEPSLMLQDFITTDSQGRGTINILAADNLFQTPVAYSTFLLWLLSELFETLPEVGDLDKPKLIFFFDEAHALFTETPKQLQEKIVQVVRLIRSKGVGIYFVTQMPIDIPDVVLGQLGNRVQHALRAFTPRDLQAVKTVADTFRPNPEIDVASAVTELQVGEALMSFLDETGTPGIVQRGLVIPPRSRVGPILPQERMNVMATSPMAFKYDTPVDRESAYEVLLARNEQEAAQAQADAEAAAAAKQAALEQKERERQERASRSSSRNKGSVGGEIIGDIVGGAGTQIGRELGRSISRGLLGGLFKTKR